MKASEQQQDVTQNYQVHVSPDLEYCYRDIANIYVGAGDVIFEFGNIHRAMPGNITIGNRVVLTMANAVELHQKLGQVLQEAQKQMQEQLSQGRQD